METEAALIIVSIDAKAMAEKIASLDRIEQYDLMQLPHRHIHDIYFDNLTGELEQLRFVLRVREVNAAYFITFKGVSDVVNQSISKRTEIEEPWSERSIYKISEILRGYGIRMKPAITNTKSHDPIRYMKSLGFEIIQDRENYRKPSNLISDSNDKVLAEFSVDFVTYHFEAQDVRLYNIEIESKSEGAVIDIERITNKLIEIYSPSVKVWPYSKIATGKIIERLLISGHLKDFLNEKNELTPAGYDIVLQLLRAQQT